MGNYREIREGPQEQGTDESIKYTLTTTNLISSPESASATIYSYDGSTYTDVTATNMTGSASISGDVITLPTIHSLVEGTNYRVEVQFVKSGNTFEYWAYLVCNR